ncbi:hypothetical protein H4R34_001007 [Dimargaris verticillata]|uniref:glucan endo-1,3-beta-D-glucosidase n=1 Tax=Dimargaris verticillata TaxID=2761393 RepID=A0A9W8EEV8_9FUNG|nr:hypothetical protein H4R34_001007 [Dimargaris verticillata]
MPGHHQPILAARGRHVAHFDAKEPNVEWDIGHLQDRYARLPHRRAWIDGDEFGVDLGPDDFEDEEFEEDADSPPSEDRFPWSPTVVPPGPSHETPLPSKPHTSTRSPNSHPSNPPRKHAQIPSEIQTEQEPATVEPVDTPPLMSIPSTASPAPTAESSLEVDASQPAVATPDNSEVSQEEPNYDDQEMDNPVMPDNDHDALLGSGAPPFPVMENIPKPSQLWGAHKGPYHTNRWWLNLVLDKGTEPIAPYPYLVKPTDEGVVISTPMYTHAEAYVASSIVDTWVFSAQQTPRSRRLLANDDLTATYEWQFDQGGRMKSTFVKGSPYNTFRVDKVALKFGTIHAILSIDQGNARRTTIKLNNGETWLLYHNRPLKLTQAAGAKGMTTLASQGPYSGVVRLAVAPSDSAVAILDHHSATYVTGAKTRFVFNSDHEFELQYQFGTAGGKPSDLLMLSLDHQQALLVNPQRVNLKGYRCIKGPLNAVAGNRWSLRYQSNPIQWFAPNAIRREDLAELQKTLEVDIAQSTSVAASDPYFFGKGIARIARLALIAEHAGRKDLIAPVVATLKQLLEPWLAARNSNPFVYDKAWRGVCSKAGISDAGADFGNGQYNDHHFHYGYFVYAAAVVGKYDHSWLVGHRTPLLALVRDYANPSHVDGNFPFLRHMDLFDGHSWASGIVPFGDGRNQESTSEAVNGYYALYLLGLALQDTAVARVGNALATMEVLSARTYWHMSDKHSVYSLEFSKNKVVGIMWTTKVDHATWFGANLEYIHGIQALPFTPISTTLLDKAWVQESYPVLQKALTRPDPPMQESWKEYVYMYHAIIDKNAARQEIRSIHNHDDGNSASNALYWVSTC